MNNHHVIHSLLIVPILGLIFSMTVGAYVTAVILSNKKYNRRWPVYRIVFWILGIAGITLAVVGPITNHSHAAFKIHMFGHLLLGMLSPLLIVMSAPITLLMRVLHVKMARRLSVILKSWPVYFLSDPLVATFLNVGGLWVLYTTNLYPHMQQHLVLHIFVHLHVFLAGLLYTSSIIYIAPTPHRRSFIYRAIVLVVSLAGHEILSKYIFRHPPGSISLEDAEYGGMLMYYGGDAIDAIITMIFCYQWYKAKRPRLTIETSLDR